MDTVVSFIRRGVCNENRSIRHYKACRGLSLLLSAVPALAITIETVPVGNPGNAGEWTGDSYGGWGPDHVCGAVAYAYNIGKYEVTAGQYFAFLNAVAATDAYGLYNTEMWSFSGGCKIQGAVRVAVTPTAWPPTGQTAR